MDTMKVDYHVHTSYSYDSRSDLRDVVRRAEACGLDMICITDHDTLDAQQAMDLLPPSTVQVLLGCEFTTDDGSHVIGIGLHELITERKLPALAAAIRNQGGLVLLPHLYRRGSGIFRDEASRTPEFIEAALADADLVEVFNGRDTYSHNQRSRQLVHERNLPCVAGSDAHVLEEIGSVYVAYERTAVMRHGISPGRFFFPHQDAPAKSAIGRYGFACCRAAYRMLPHHLRRGISRRINDLRARRMRPAQPQFAINSRQVRSR